MRVGWLPGRQTETVAPCAMPGFDVVSLDSGDTLNLPDVVILDQVEPEVVAHWARLPLVLVLRCHQDVTPSVEEQEAILFTLAPSSDAGALQQTLHNAQAAALRLRQIRARLAEVQRRLTDRIVVEKAKGLLTKRFGLSEEEAYRRMRLQSRQERRPMREIAEALLTSCEILPLEALSAATVTA